MQVPIASLVAQMVGLFLAFVLLLFLPAGTLRWWEGWAYIVLFFAGSIWIIIWLFKHNPGLLNERLTGVGKADQKPWDKVMLGILIPLYIIWTIIMPLDAVRFGWSHVPLWLKVVGGGLVVVSYYLFFLVYRENSFLSPAIRIQHERNQTVVTTGPYRIVRHPMYASFVVQFIGVSLLLGSWLGLVFGLLFTLVASRRAILEERTLRDELPGYADYMEKVHYRLIPGIW